MKRASWTVIALTILFLLTIAVQARTFSVIHTFTGGLDGAYPNGLTIDRAGNLYGTAGEGGNSGYGTVFKLSHKGSGWVFSPLYSFQGGNDGQEPAAGVTIGSNGSLYGTTMHGGGIRGCYYLLDTCGTVFNLRPSASACKTAFCFWNETVLYIFDGSNGAYPSSAVIFDPMGNMYFNTEGDSYLVPPAIIELTPSNGSWNETLNYQFIPYINGPNGGLVLDTTGNLYGVAGGGTYGYGTVFELITSDSGWTENILYNFQGGSDGSGPTGGVIFDPSGNLYGATASGGSDGNGCAGLGCGTAFELTPSSGGQWTESIIYSFTGGAAAYYYGPYASLTMDAAGNLYGTTISDGPYGFGTAFKLTPSYFGWIYSDLHDFTGGSDGAYPSSSLIFDANGNLYGTTDGGGTGDGVVFEITP
jgi:uncharacterized repeat protein (TIGR03803 family)